jgi:hypothetical protein
MRSSPLFCRCFCAESIAKNSADMKPSHSARDAALALGESLAGGAALIMGARTGVPSVDIDANTSMMVAVSYAALSCTT